MHGGHAERPGNQAVGAHTKKLEWLNVKRDCAVSGEIRIPRIAMRMPPSARPVSAADIPSPMYLELRPSVCHQSDTPLASYCNTALLFMVPTAVCLLYTLALAYNLHHRQVYSLTSYAYQRARKPSAAPQYGRGARLCASLCPTDIQTIIEKTIMPAPLPG